MDIYSFINSKDIAEHCRTIGHEFTPLEMAFVVYSSDKTLSERHSAWKWIIDTQPDMEMPERRNMAQFDSLHQFLCDYMALENQIVDIFRTEEANAVYTCDEYLTHHSANLRCICGILFPTYDAVLTKIKEEDGDIIECRITKRWIGEEYKEIIAYTTYNGITSIRERFVINDEKLTDLICLGFEGMWIEVPTPFKMGDIVIHQDTAEPLVLDYLCYWARGRFTQELIDRLKKDWDTTDMTGYGYKVSGEGRIWRCDDIRSYLDLEYYRDELKEEYRTLLALSNYIKEKPEISADFLLNAYEVILHDEYIRARANQSRRYEDEQLEKAGLKDREPDEAKIAEARKFANKIISEHKTVFDRLHNYKFNDIYDFIPSRDIAAHCRALAHTFTPLEQATIIYHSKKPLPERHKAWQNIIDTLPDMKVTEWTGSKHERTLHNSLHQFLKGYMRIENTLSDRLKIKEPDTIYTYSVRYISEIDGDCHHNNTPRSTFDTAVKAFNEGEGSNLKNCLFRIYKRWFDMVEDEKFFNVCVNSGGEILDWNFWFGGFLGEADGELFSAFSDISIYIPVPFRKGDTLTYDNGTPFVLEYDEWQYGQKHSPEERFYLAAGSVSDTINGFYVRENGSIYSDFSPAMLDIEYFKGELTGVSRVLKAISSHIKGEISVDLLMNAYDIITQEERLKDRQEDLDWYTEKGLALVGLEKIKDKKLPDK